MHKKILRGTLLLAFILLLTSCGRMIQNQVEDRLSKLAVDLSEAMDSIDQSLGSESDEADDDNDDDMTSQPIEGTETSEIDIDDSDDDDDEAPVVPPTAAEVVFPGFTLGDLSSFDHDLWDEPSDRPQPPGDIISTSELDGYVQYQFTGMTDDHYRSYVNKLREMGFVYEAVLSDDLMYQASREDGLIAQVFVFDDEGTGLLYFSEDDDVDRTSIFVSRVGTEHEFNADEMGGVKDLGDTISNYSIVEGNTSYTFAEIVDAAKYVEAIKEAGYTHNPFSSKSENQYSYNASNAEGDQMYFWGTSGETGWLSFTARDFD